MLSNSLVKDFQIRLGRKFILPVIEEEFADYFAQENSNYQKLIDFVNNTIIETTVLGLESQSSPEQSFGRGQIKSHNGSLHKDKKRTRTITLTFSNKKTHLNYMILYRNMEEFEDGDQTLEEDDETKDGFYDDLYLDMIDSNGNLVYSWVYSGIQVNKLSEIRLAKNDRSISTNQFTMDLTFNKVSFVSHLNKERSDLNSTYKHDFEDGGS